MKLPPRRSRLYKMLDTLRQHGPLTLEAGLKLHGLSVRTLADLAAMYEELMAMGCVERAGKKYRISAALLAHDAEQAELAALAPAPLPTVPPRTVPPFRPLNRKYLVSSKGQREGSNDLHDVPSLYAKLGT